MITIIKQCGCVKKWSDSEYGKGKFYSSLPCENFSSFHTSKRQKLDEEEDDILLKQAVLKDFAEKDARRNAEMAKREENALIIANEIKNRKRLYFKLSENKKAKGLGAKWDYNSKYWYISSDKFDEFNENMKMSVML